MELNDKIRKKMHKASSFALIICLLKPAKLNECNVCTWAFGFARNQICLNKQNFVAPCDIYFRPNVLIFVCSTNNILNRYVLE